MPEPWEPASEPDMSPDPSEPLPVEQAAQASLAESPVDADEELVAVEVEGQGEAVEETGDIDAAVPSQGKDLASAEASLADSSDALLSELEASKNQH